MLLRLLILLFTHFQCVTQYYAKKGAIEGPCISVEFGEDRIELDIPMEGINIGGWRITPLMSPMVHFMSNTQEKLLESCLISISNKQICCFNRLEA